MNKWRLWLQTFSCGLLILTAFAPLPEIWDKILGLMGVVGLLVYLCTDSVSRREVVRFGIPLVALVLLALLLSINPKWVVYGFVGVAVGSILWELDKPKHAEYLAERERLK